MEIYNQVINNNLNNLLNINKYKYIYTYILFTVYRKKIGLKKIVYLFLLFTVVIHSFTSIG